jgi:hypothetical protein
MFNTIATFVILNLPNAKRTDLATLSPSSSYVETFHDGAAQAI